MSYPSAILDSNSNYQSRRVEDTNLINQWDNYVLMAKQSLFHNTFPNMIYRWLYGHLIMLKKKKTNLLLCQVYLVPHK